MFQLTMSNLKLEPHFILDHFWKFGDFIHLHLTLLVAVDTWFTGIDLNTANNKFIFKVIVPSLTLSTWCDFLT